MNRFDEEFFEFLMKEWGLDPHQARMVAAILRLRGTGGREGPDLLTADIIKDRLEALEERIKAFVERELRKQMLWFFATLGFVATIQTIVTLALIKFLFPSAASAAASRVLALFS
jgi:hypothetical protein